MPISDNAPPEPLSKTQRKKDMIALQKLGETLVSLSSSQLAKIPLPDELLKAIQLAHTLKSHEAKRRHMQYIGKIMRDMDAAVILDALKKIKYKGW